MSSSDRRTVLALMAGVLLATPGCLRPMLAEGTPNAALRGRIRFPSVDDRFGYFLNESLQDRLGATDAPRYRLEIRTELSDQGIAIAQDNSVTRVTLSATAWWSLWQDGGAEPLLNDKVTVQSGYNATTSLFATRQTRKDIERRLARDLGERISRTILARAGQLPA